MVGDLEAEAEIGLITKEFEKGSDKIKKEFDEMGKSAKTSGDKTDKSLKKTGAEAKKTAEKLKGAGAAGKKAGNDAAAGGSKGAAGVKKMGDAANSTSGDMTTLSVSIIGLGQAVTGITDALFGFNEKIVALERSTFGLKELTVQVTREEEDLAVAIRAGTLSAIDQTRAIEDLGFSYEALHIEAKTVRAEQEALNGEYVTFGINTLGVVAQSIIAVTVLMQTDTGAKIANAIATKGLSGAIWGAVLATKAFTTAMLTSPLAPYAIAAIAAGTAFIALNDNIGKTRDHIEDLTGQERGSFPTLGFSITGLGEDMENGESAMRDYGQESILFAESIGLTTDSVILLNDALNPGATTALGDFGTSLDSVKGKLVPFANGIFDATGKLVNLSERTGGASKVLDGWTKAMFASNDAIKEQNNLLDENTKKKQQISHQSQTKGSEGSSLDDEDNGFFGKNGTFFGGTTLFGFRGETYTVAGFDAAGNPILRNFRSRITGPSTPAALGGTGPKSSPFGGGHQPSAAGIAALGNNPTRAGQGNQKGVNQGGGSANRHDNYQVLKALDKIWGGDRNRAQTLEEQTGMDLGLRVTRRVQRGRSERPIYHFAEMNAKIAEAKTRVSLVSQINAINPVLGVTAGQSSQELQSILNTENANVSSLSSTLSLSTESIIEFNQTAQGQSDISNMIAFLAKSQQEALVASTV